MNELAKALKALSEETRLQIAALLIWQGELCVCDVEGVLGITQSKASRHLRYLLNAGLVKNRRAGVWMHYYIPKDLPPPQKQIVAMLKLLPVVRPAFKLFPIVLREMGLEVHIEPLNPDEEPGCTTCMKDHPELYKVIYTRKPTDGRAG